MLVPVLLFIVGLLCLIKGGDWFVDGATGIARRFHVPELLIGWRLLSSEKLRSTPLSQFPFIPWRWSCPVLPYPGSAWRIKLLPNS